jgi:signal transduction histidine kinase
VSVRGRVAAAVAGTSLAFVCVACVALFVLVAVNLSRTAEKDATRAARGIAPGSSSLDAACERIREGVTARDTGQWLMVVGSDGRERCRSNLAVTRPTAAMRRVERGEPRRLKDRDGETVMVAASQISGGRVVAVRRFEGWSMLPLLAVAGVVVSFTAAFVAAWVGSAVGSRATRDVSRLLDDMRRAVAAPVASQRLGEHRLLELHEIAIGFDQLLDRVDHGARMHRQLVLDAAHQLRTPLTSLSSNVQLLQAPDALGVNGAGEILADITRQTRALAALVSDLVDVAAVQERIYAGVPVQACHLDDVVLEVARRMRELHPQRRIEVTSTPMEVEGDGDLLARAVINLVDNALTHGPPDGLVGIHQDGAMVKVTDDGPGFDRALLQQNVQPFHRDPSGGAVAGTGLGLTFAARVAEAFGGTLDAAPRTEQAPAFVGLLLTSPGRAKPPGLIDNS